MSHPATTPQLESARTVFIPRPWRDLRASTSIMADSTINASQEDIISPKQSPSDSPPPLAALFLIEFDLKVGYTIAWKQSLPNVPLEGVVEYKSLPSGLHNVKEDLVYFVHDTTPEDNDEQGEGGRYAGVSAFVNAPAGQEQRNASFIAVGAMVRVGDGRLGRAWEHAEELKGLARETMKDINNLSPLEEYWEDNRIRPSSSSSGKDRVSPFTAAQKRTRGLSSTTLATAPNNQTLPPYHPAHSILDYLDTFGPLVFPLHRAALLRKRILFVGSAPVRGSCEFVYDLSILSSLPISLSSNLPLPSPSYTRLRPLFNIGIHDIPYLAKLSKSTSIQTNGHPVEDSPVEEEHELGWIGCTTDEILAMKPDLYDILVELPHSNTKSPTNKSGRKSWPKMKRSGTGTQIKATQRDLRRYRLLRRALRPMSRHHQNTQTEDEGDNEDEHTHLLYQDNTANSDSDNESNSGEEKLAEPASWSAVAYNSFIWWASAGEKEEGLAEEEEQDHKLLSDLGETARKVGDQRQYRDGEDVEGEEDNSGNDSTQVELGVISFFHRITKLLFESSIEIIDDDNNQDPNHPVRYSDEISEEGNDEQDEEQDRRAVSIRSAELRRCGLDVWSKSDRDFLQEFVELWFQREVEVDGLGVECCGMKIC